MKHRWNFGRIVGCVSVTLSVACAAALSPVPALALADDGGSPAVDGETAADTHAPGETETDRSDTGAADGGDTLGAQASGVVGYGNVGGCRWVAYSDGTLTIGPGNGTGAYASGQLPSGWLVDAIPALGGEGVAGVTQVAILPGVAAPSNCSSLFVGCGDLTAIDASGLDTSSATDMHFMFYGCSSLASLDVSGWDTSSATGMWGMFRDCSSLASLDVSGWDTSSVTEAERMFEGCASLGLLSVGPRYVIGGADMFPDATSEGGKWWSARDGRWYAKDEVVAGRSGVADTYTSEAPGAMSRS